MFKDHSPLCPILRSVILLVALYLFASHFDSSEIKTILLFVLGDGALSKFLQAKAPPRQHP